jgi:hypothetical protein
MSLSEAALIATAISGCSATASLIYLALQTRQNVRHMRALILQGTAARTTKSIQRAGVTDLLGEGEGQRRQGSASLLRVH